MAARQQQGRKAGDAAAGGTAVQLPFGEDADVAVVRPGLQSRAGEDGAVEKAEVRAVRVGDVDPGAHDGVLDGPARLDQARMVGRGQGQPEGGRLHVGIEGAAIGQGIVHQAQALHGQGLTIGQHEGGHVQEPHPAHAPGPVLALHAVGLEPDLAAGGVDVEAGLRAGGRYPAALDGQLGQGRHRMAAHGAVAFVVQEEHAERTVAAFGRGDDRAVHVRMAAWFPHEGLAEVVQALLAVAPALQHGLPLQFWKAFDDHAKGLAARMAVDAAQAEAGRVGRPGPQGALRECMACVRRHFRNIIEILKIY